METKDVWDRALNIQRVMVLEFEPKLTCSVWKDYHHRIRSPHRLIKQLKKEIKSGRFVAFRFIEIQRECYGVPDDNF